MKRFLKDPLVHFLVIGAALFAFSAWRGEAIRTGREKIVDHGRAGRTDTRCGELSCRGRVLSDAEVAALVEPTIRDEVLYREALALGLDANDDEVRRRLIEKMSTSPRISRIPRRARKPSFASSTTTCRHASRFPSSLRSIRCSSARVRAATPRMRTPRPRWRSSTRVARRRRSAIARRCARPTSDAPREQVSVLFGDELAKAVFTLPPGAWTGPFESDFGLHTYACARAPSGGCRRSTRSASRCATEFAAEHRREAKRSGVSSACARATTSS